MNPSIPPIPHGGAASAAPAARAEAALTHPATLAALATLLVNDLVFKSLWPGSWITGKLSDLAWVVFAPPLLALPLTFLARRNPAARRAAWAIAYIGLPLLYAAYNTFEPLHDAVTGGFSLLRGTPGGSPFDPSDSIVIPFGTAIAVRVWRKAGAKTNSAESRMRLGILVAAIASVASAASSEPLAYRGIVVIERGPDGDPTYLEGAGHSARPGPLRVETPRGVYSVEGTDVFLKRDGIEERVFSSVIKNQSRDHAALLASTRRLGHRAVRLAPQDIFYDERTGNVILAMGLQGVAVGTPDGRWERMPVRDLRPLDYAVNARLMTVLGMGDLLCIAAALSLTIAAAATSIAVTSVETRSPKTVGLRFFGAAVIAALLSALFGIALLSPGLEPAAMLPLLGVSAMLAATLIVVTKKSPLVSFRDYAVPVLLLLALVSAGLGMLSFDDRSDSLGESTGWLAGAAIIVSAPVMFASVRKLDMKAILVSSAMTAAMFILFGMAFFMWADGLFTLGAAKTAAALMVAAAGIVLFLYTRTTAMIRSDSAGGMR